MSREEVDKRLPNLGDGPKEIARKRILNEKFFNDKEKEAVTNAKANAIELNKNESTLLNDYSIFSLSSSKKSSNDFFNLEK
jgi:hypothetical protein